MASILVVDDEITIGEMLRACLEEEGYEVSVAYDGRQAIEHLAERRPDLVLSDVMMPRMDGRELALRMEHDPGLRDIPLILMSASGEFIVQGRCTYAGFVAKPFELDTVVRTIEQTLTTIPSPAPPPTCGAERGA